MSRKFDAPPSSYIMPVKNKVEISQNFVAFSEYMNFTCIADLDEIASLRTLWINQAP